MMLLCNINNNILIYHPPYSSVYQDGYEKLDIYQNIIVLGVGTKKTVVHITHEIINKYHTTFLKGVWVLWDYCFKII